MATSGPPFAQVASECESEGLNRSNVRKIGQALARTFGVHHDEVGIMRVREQNLVFCHPTKLDGAGSIPLNTSNSVAARTATTRRAEVINNFAQIKHTSVFEAVELAEKRASDDGVQTPDYRPKIIQKLMSAPVIGPAGVVGVVQVSRKGASGASAGADFTSADLKKLVLCAEALAKCFK